MQIQRINPTINTKQPQFKAVNQKYLEWAKRDIAIGKNVSGDWLDNISFDVFLFKKLSRQDALDTIYAVKKILNFYDEGIEETIKSFLNPNP